MTGSWCFTVTIHWQPPRLRAHPKTESLFFHFHCLLLWMLIININIKWSHTQPPSDTEWMSALKKGSNCHVALLQQVTQVPSKTPPTPASATFSDSLLSSPSTCDLLQLSCAARHCAADVADHISWFPSRFIYAHFECAHNKTGRRVKAFTLGVGEEGDILMEKRYC